MSRRPDIRLLLDNEGQAYDPGRIEEAFLLFEAAWKYPHKSEEWCELIALGQRAFDASFPARKGHPDGLADDAALAYMQIEAVLSGVRGAQKLARAAIEKGLVPSKSVQPGTTEGRLARKYGALMRAPWPLHRWKNACLHLWLAGAISTDEYRIIVEM